MRVDFDWNVKAKKYQFVHADYLPSMVVIGIDILIWAYSVKIYATKDNFVQNWPKKTIYLILLSYILFLIN